jgi:hypothetical protein
MKKSLIPWHIFREALEGQNPEALEHWLGRWGFSNDGVVLIGADIRSVSQLLSFPRRKGAADTVALNTRASLHELVELLIHEPSMLMEEAAQLWCYEKEL